MTAARSVGPLASPSTVVRNLEEAIVWTDYARHDDATAGECALLTRAMDLLVAARACVVRALATMNGGK